MRGDEPLTTQTPTPHRSDHLDLFELAAVFTVRDVTTSASRLVGINLPLSDSARPAPSESGVVRIRTVSPVAVDNDQHNRSTGCLVLADEATNITVVAGMVGPPVCLEKN